MRAKSAAGIFVLIGLGAIGAMLECEDEHERPRPSAGRSRPTRAYLSHGHRLAIAATGSDGGVGVGDGGVVDGPCLSGTAVDSYGHPVAGADVRITVEWPEERAGETSETRTDADGRFEVCGEYQVSADVYDAEGRWGRAFFEPRFGGSPTIELVERTILTGRVVDPEGTPVHGAAIELGDFVGRADDGSVDRLDRPRTRELTGGEWISGPDGRFELPISVPGLYTVEARYPGFPVARAGPIALAGGTEHHVEFELVTGTIFRGQVLGDVGPLAGADVSVFERNERLRVATTDADGRFTIPGILDETLGIQIDSPRFALFETEVSLEGEHVFQLTAAATLVVRVTLSPLLEGCVTDNLLEVEATTNDTYAAARFSDGVAALERLRPSFAYVFVRGMGMRARATIDLSGRVSAELEVALTPGEDHGLVRVAPFGGERTGVIARIGDRHYFGRSDLPLCVMVPAGEHTIIVTDALERTRMTGTVRVIAGHSTEWSGTHEPVPSRDPSEEVEEGGYDEQRTCSPPLDLRWDEERYVVAYSAPRSSRLRPGDVVLNVDGVSADDEDQDLELALNGDCGSVATVTVLRDGTSRTTAALTRERTYY
jgi:hypothetical protein